MKRISDAVHPHRSGSTPRWPHPFISAFICVYLWPYLWEVVTRSHSRHPLTGQLGDSAAVYPCKLPIISFLRCMIMGRLSDLEAASCYTVR